MEVAVEGPDRHPMKLVEGTLDSMVIKRPDLTADKLQDVRMERGYDYPQVRELVEVCGYAAHVRAR